MTPTYTMGWKRGSTSAEGKNVSSFTSPIRPTKNSTHWVLGTSGPVAMQPDQDAEHSLPKSDEVRNAWSYTSSVEKHVHNNNNNNNNNNIRNKLDEVSMIGM